MHFEISLIDWKRKSGLLVMLLVMQDEGCEVMMVVSVEKRRCLGKNSLVACLWLLQGIVLHN